MLTRVGSGKSEYRYGQKTDALVRIGDANERPLFPWRLEYNCPVHENWNIVHTGMLLPETQQIYVCSDNCLRGVILTAAEMGCLDRISSVMPDENEVVNGKLEEVTIEGVTDVIGKLEKRPKAVELFLVCMHHQLGTDFRYIFDTLGKRFPDISFLPCFMDPIMQKVSLTPEQKQRKAMMDLLPDLPRKNNIVSVFGDNLRLPETSDISRLLTAQGFEIRQVQDCASYADYLSMGEAVLYLTRSALSVYGLKAAAEKNKRKHLYLPPAAGDEEIGTLLSSLLESLSGLTEKTPAFNLSAFLSEEKEKTKASFAAAKAAVGDRAIELDYLAFSRPLALARRLLSEGFAVRRVYIDGISPEEHADFLFLKEHHPDLLLQSTNSPFARVKENLDREKEKPVLALGPKAAFFSDTQTFVNWIENDGNWGYDGLRKLCDAMTDAVEHPKNPEDMVQRKGLGWPSLVEEIPPVPSGDPEKAGDVSAPTDGKGKGGAA